MDSFYPAKAAAIAIGEWSNKMCKEDAPLIKMGMAWPATALNNELVTIKELEGSQSAKAMFPTAGPHHQEAVFTVVGALKAKDLPPVKGTRPHASLARWDAPCFKKALENMQEAAYTMCTAFDENTIEPWRPEYLDDHNTQISSNCHYFTVGRNILSKARTKFHPKTDPHGVLARHLSENVAHCFDNDVMYMVFKGEEYVEKDPGTSKTGDIVEMGFALVAWKKQGKNVGPDWSCMLVLRTLTFLDGRFTKEAHFAREAYKAQQIKTRAGEDQGHADNHIPKSTENDAVHKNTERRLSCFALEDNHAGTFSTLSLEPQWRCTRHRHWRTFGLGGAETEDTTNRRIIGIKGTPQSKYAHATQSSEKSGLPYPVPLPPTDNPPSRCAACGKNIQFAVRTRSTCRRAQNALDGRAFRKKNQQHKKTDPSVYAPHLVVDHTVFISVDVVDEVASNKIIHTEPVAGIWVWAARTERTRRKKIIQHLFTYLVHFVFSALTAIPASGIIMMASFRPSQSKEQYCGDPRLIVAPLPNPGRSRYAIRSFYCPQWFVDYENLLRYLSTVRNGVSSSGAVT
ncbi:hypothetical protein DFH08DRAFT_825101 [Mycena albidolilacea]|uniref:Uncharacterized protein n=1 Tax=Mycena albidolilacea TaxID=1033008 RepID=A0AAD6Z316_9AGAR|nr:hypothetical protein DFH08DRAFT_825101 [Mycena albidolilacea]